MQRSRAKSLIIDEKVTSCVSADKKDLVNLSYSSSGSRK